MIAHIESSRGLSSHLMSITRDHDGAESPMTLSSDKPLLLVVVTDPVELRRIKDELFSRYARHYDVVCQSSPAEAIVEAMTLGHIDYYVLKPWRSPDELFHRTITVFLHEWSRTQPTARPQIAVVGEQWAKRSQEVRELLTRFRIDHAFHDGASREGGEVLGRAGVTAERLPVVATLNGEVLVDPSNAQIAEAFGVRTSLRDCTDFDVVVVGAGPAGLGAAVYGSSEGLRTLVVEREAIGGQAGSSSLIRNYVGFAKGVSGSELAQQAFQQAWVFGTTFLMTRAVTGIRDNGAGFTIALSNGEQAASHAVVLAMGVSYRRL